VILIDSYQGPRDVLATRLRAQGYEVEPVEDSATGADMALSAPPAVVVADLWMPGISGIQICRLLRSEPATADVPVILRGETDDPKSRFWAERAGAAAYVVKGRMGDLVRALGKAVSSSPVSDPFFMQLSEGTRDIRDRIAQHLDAALFESVIAAEVRALASEGSFDRLFDLLSQLLSQLAGYRWLALATHSPQHFGIHHHPKLKELAAKEAPQALELLRDVDCFLVEDEDALPAAEQAAPIVCPVMFGGVEIGRIALSVPRGSESDGASLLPLVARELGGPIRMTALIEDSRMQASTDPLTGLMNRRAFLQAVAGEVARCERHGYSLCIVLLDIDHFKHINDQRGHAAGDEVLARIGALLRGTLRKSDFGVRWGGEEFIVGLTSTDLDGGRVLAERLLRAVENLEILDTRGESIPVTGSLGLACHKVGESIQQLIDRADRAMYTAKVGGRNRLVVDDGTIDGVGAPPSGAADGGGSAVALHGEEQARPRSH
jgi:two-component system cell cycle response regulator